MIKHVVLMKFKADVDADILKECLVLMDAMQEKIPQVIKLDYGTNAGILPPQFDHGTVVEFASKEDCLAYLAHPAHVEVGEKIKPLLESAAQFQFEC